MLHQMEFYLLLLYRIEFQISFILQEMDWYFTSSMHFMLPFLREQLRGYKRQMTRVRRFKWYLHTLKMPKSQFKTLS